MMKKSISTLLILHPLFYLTACVPTTTAGVRELPPARAITFNAPENYQAVYTKILNQTRKCRDAWVITANIITQGDLYPDKKMGTVSVSMRGGLGRSVYQVIDVVEISANESKVTGYFSVGYPEKYGADLKQWTLNNSTECS